MKLPNLIIAGPPKCGTSSLFNWLIAHPEVSGTPCKETFYFIDIDSPLLKSEANYNLHGLERYSSFFPDESSQGKILVEATPHYIYQKTALDFFAACKPQPHVIFILRKPSKRIFSAFSFVQHNLARLDKNISFEQVTEILLEGKIEQIKDWGYSEDSFFWRWLQNQLSNNRYYDFLIRWADRFSQDKMIILLFEEMVAAPQNTLRYLANKLDIKPDFYNRFYFEKRTQTVAIKNRLIHQNLIKLAPCLATSQIRGIFKSLYFKLNTIPPTGADPNSLKRLDQYFTPYNRQLAEAFNLNLDCWK
jgi:hypothetical protein